VSYSFCNLLTASNKLDYWDIQYLIIFIWITCDF